jgi:ribose transport system permease protein
MRSVTEDQHLADGERSDAAEQNSTGRRAQALLRLVALSRGNGALVLTIVCTAVAGIAIKNFATSSNIIQLLESESYVGLAAIGMTFVVLAGQFIDLSVPASAALAANALYLSSRSLPVALLCAFGLPAIVGCLNGFLIGAIGVNAVVCTLGTATAVTGAILLWSGGGNVYGHQPGFDQVANTSVAGIPVVTVAFLALLVIAQLVLSYTGFGARLRLTGANLRAAGAIGVRTTRVIAGCFILSALFAATSGVFLAAFSGAAQLTTGAGYDFGSLVPVVIGGTALIGGVGSFWRTLVGLALIGVITNAMLLLGAGTSAQLTATAVIFVTAVALDASTQRTD